jgi:mannose-6-phosphate isomerase class I
MTTVIENIEGAVKAAEKVVSGAFQEGSPAAEVKAIEAEIKTIEISTEEKLNLRNLENDFLKNTLEMQRLQGLLSTTQKQFPSYIQSLAKKYSVDEKLFQFDAIKQVFSKL